MESRGRSWFAFQQRIALVLALAAVSSAGCTGPSGENRVLEPRGFSEPGPAAMALADALEAEGSEELEALFGSGAETILTSGDATSDQGDRLRVLSLLREGHRIESVAEDFVVLHLGDIDWPFPVPLVKTNDGWIFDVEAGKEEIIDRRVGRNEIDTIQVCLAYVDAQREYVREDRDGDGVLEYAQKLASDAGKTDGLYWPTAPGEPASPLGSLVAEARAEGYTARGRDSGPIPYHGYVFRLLTRQGAHAPSGAYDYVAGENMIGGFALLACPAEYGSSGVMSFIVNHDGAVMQKDLGEKTAQVAAELREYDPDATWTAVGE